MKRRRLSILHRFAIVAFMTCFLIAPVVCFSSDDPVSKPNILVIITDQQHAHMMGCAGNPYVRTPHLDKLASEGMRFERAYATNPVCVPSRFSLMTGLLPSIIRMEDNDGQRNQVPPEIFESTMGRLFSQAGYETAYAGKMHLTGATSENGFENPFVYGFSRYLTPNDREGRDETVQACAQFLEDPHDRPFLLIASLINPHDICYLPLLDWVETEKKNNPYASTRAAKLIKEILQIPEGMDRDEFIEKYCPPLPGNFDIPDHELPSFTTVKQDNYIGWSRRNYTEKEWRLYRYLYARLTEVVDNQIGQLLKAVEGAGLKSNTLVVFTSDHGDQDAAHRTGLKGYLYEESANIPFFLRLPGAVPANQVDQIHLVSNGLDLVPTLCDFAGIPVPSHLPGLSLRALAAHGDRPPWRTTLVVENNSARLLLYDRHWKYMVDAASSNTDGGDRTGMEMLFNLERDPGELENLAALQDPGSHAQLRRARDLLRKWYSDHDITIADSNLKTINKVYLQ